MASSYTDIGTELMTTGENAGTWGTKTNTNIQILEEAINGYVALNANSDQTLSYTDGSLGDVIRHSVIALTGTLSANRTITVPANEKIWIFDNQTSGAYTLTIKASGQTGVAWGASDKGTKILYANGTDVIDTSTTGGVGGHDLNGEELILDLDGDTSITADTDDQIDIRIGGTDQITIKDGALSPVTDNDIDLGTASLEFKDAFFDGTVTSDAFAGPLTGDVTGNVSGTAATVTTAAQTNITSLGTLTTLTVDNMVHNGDTITMTPSASDTATMTAATNGAFSLVTVDAAAAAANIQITADGTVDIDSAGVLTLDSGAAINIEPAVGSAILLDGTISVDAGVVTGATSITSTAFVGNVTGNASGNAATATALETARTIGGTSFDGSANIAVALAATSTALATARTIAGQSFDGSANIAIASTNLSNTSNITLNDGTQTLTNKTLTSPVINTGTFGTSILPTSADGTTLGSASKEFSDLFLADSSTIQFGNDQDTTLTHTDGTGLTLNSTNKLCFNDTGTHIFSNADGDLDIVSDGTEIESIKLTSAGGMRLDANSTSLPIILDSAYGEISLSKAGTGFGSFFNLSSGLRIRSTTSNADMTFAGVDGGASITALTLDMSEAGAATFNNAITSGAVITSGAGVVVADAGTIGSASDTDAIAIGADGDITLTQDLELQHDGAILSFGANDEVTLTHVHNDGLLLNTDMQLQFRDSAINIRSDADGDLDINADDEVEINSTLIDINGNVEMSGTLAQAGVATFAVAANVAQVALTSSSNATAWDASAAANAYHLTTENTTFSAPSNAVEGAFIAVEINYNGSHTIAFNTVFEFAASTAPTTTDTDGKTDILVFRYNGAVWQEVGRTLNLSES